MNQHPGRAERRGNPLVGLVAHVIASTGKTVRAAVILTLVIGLIIIRR
jgi:hypothetical protein